jgi:hypothetical protein
MQILRLNPEWQWAKWTNAALTDGELRVKRLNERKYRPVSQNPAPQYSLKMIYELLQPTEVRDDNISRWLQDYGPLDLSHSIYFDVHTFINEAHHIWWITSVLDEFRKHKINPRELSKEHTIGNVLVVPNPLRREAADPYFPAAQRALNTGLLLEDKNWSVPYVELIHDIIITIDHYLEQNTFVKNEVHPNDQLPWQLERDRYGRRNQSTLKDVETYLKISTVIEPRNLSGYIWLRLQEQLDELPNYYYYNCLQMFTPVRGHECYTYLKRKLTDNICKYCAELLTEKHFLSGRDVQLQLHETGQIIFTDEHSQLVDSAGLAVCPKNLSGNVHADGRSRRLWCSQACHIRAKRDGWFKPKMQ